MKNHILLARARALKDEALLFRLEALAGDDRRLAAEQIAHLAELRARPSVYASKGYGSLFGYCTQALKLSEDVACTRIAAAKACRRFPVILDLLISGALSQSAVRLLHKHLTPENHESVLARAQGRSRRQVEALVAELAPKPDPRPILRALSSSPAPAPTAGIPVAGLVPSLPLGDAPATPAPPPPPAETSAEPPAPAARYRLACTLDAEAESDLRALQDLLRREIPDGDPGQVIKRALAVLRQKEEARRFGRTKRPRPAPSARPGTGRPSRHVPAAVRREASGRDGDRCAFVSRDGRRCTERAFVEFHHREPYARGGPSTTENIALHCFLHNQHEARLAFGSVNRR